MPRIRHGGTKRLSVAVNSSLHIHRKSRLREDVRQLFGNPRFQPDAFAASKLQRTAGDIGVEIEVVRALGGLSGKLSLVYSMDGVSRRSS